MITANGIYPIAIAVNDVQRSVKFYPEILGMTVFKLNRLNHSRFHLLLKGLSQEVICP